MGGSVVFDAPGALLATCRYGVFRIARQDVSFERLNWRKALQEEVGHHCAQVAFAFRPAGQLKGPDLRNSDEDAVRRQNANCNKAAWRTHALVSRRKVAENSATRSKGA
jgi:hypothetical protein